MVWVSPSPHPSLVCSISVAVCPAGYRNSLCPEGYEPAGGALGMFKPLAVSGLGRTALSLRADVPNIPDPFKVHLVQIHKSG
jgi:hypothetical protein